MDNVVSLTPLKGVEDCCNDTTTVGLPRASADPRARAQLRVPLNDLDELLMHLHLIENAVEKCRKEASRAKRNHRSQEALVLCRHHLNEVNRLMNVKHRDTRR